MGQDRNERGAYARGAGIGKGDFRYGLVASPRLERLAEAYRWLGEDVKDFRPVWDELAPKMIASTSAVWDSQGAALGQKWAPLSPRYVRRKARESHFAGMMLVRTGRTYDQLHSSAGILRRTKKLLSFGADRAQTRATQFGRLGRQPPRPMLGWTDALKGEAKRAMESHIDRLVSRAISKTTGAA